MKAIKALAILFIIGFSTAHAQWEYGGIEIVPTSWQTWEFHANKDVNGGILLAWEDNREIYNPDVYIQKVDSAGIILWQEYGVKGAVSDVAQYRPFVVSDNQGGAYIAWTDLGRNGTNYDIYAQHLNYLGERSWDDGGLNIVFRGGHQILDHMISDGHGGAILCWSDDYWAYTDTLPVVVQRIDSSGNLLYGIDGIRATTLQEGWQSCSQLTMTSDSAFIVIWIDSRLFGQGPGLYAQKFDIYGNILWDSAGVPVAVETVDVDCGEFNISPGPAGGLYAIWKNHLGPQVGISMQRINSQGHAMWGSSGLVISNNFWDRIPKIATNNDGRAIFAWVQGDPYKSFMNIIDTTGTLNWGNHFLIDFHINFVYGIVQSMPGEFEIGLEKTDLGCRHRIFKFDTNGNYIWGDSGVCLTCPPCPSIKQKILSDGVGGDYLSWKRFDGGGVMLNRVYPDGWVAPDTTTGTESDLILPDPTIKIRVYPNPFNSNVVIVYSASNLGPQPPHVTLKVYDIQGRVVKTLVNDRVPVGTYRAVWDGTNDNGEPVASGTYIARVFQWGMTGGNFPVKITLIK